MSGPANIVPCTASDANTAANRPAGEAARSFAGQLPRRHGLSVFRLAPHGEVSDAASAPFPTKPREPIYPRAFLARAASLLTKNLRPELRSRGFLKSLCEAYLGQGFLCISEKAYSTVTSRLGRTTFIHVLPGVSAISLPPASLKTVCWLMLSRSHVPRTNLPPLKI